MTLINSLIRSELKLDTVLNEEVLLIFDVPQMFKTPNASFIGGPSLGALLLLYALYKNHNGPMESRRTTTTQLVYTNTPNEMKRWRKSQPTQVHLSRRQTERVWEIISCVGENILELHEELELFDILFNKPIPEAVQLQLELT